MRSNLPLLERVAARIAPLLDELVFLGGATTELFRTSPAGGRVRITRDADVICEVAGRGAYHHLGERLRRLGFSEDTSPEAPLCRWRADSDVLDVMPVDGTILGFTNEWYPYAIRTASWVPITPSLRIRLVSAPVFLATKLAAYAGRGEGDLLASHDIEDVLTVVSFRQQILDEVRSEEEELRRWLAIRIRETLVDHPDFEDALHGSLPDARIVPSLIGETRRRLQQLATQPLR